MAAESQEAPPVNTSDNIIPLSMIPDFFPPPIKQSPVSILTSNTNDDDYFKNFTAGHAQHLATKYYNGELKSKMNKYKKACIESIKACILKQVDECTFSVEGGNNNLHDLFFKYFKTEMRFLISKSIFKENEFILRWHPEETKMLSQKEISILADKVVQQGNSYDGEVFSVYHAQLFEMESHKLLIDNIVEKLIISCMKEIVQSINSNTKSFMFTIPYGEFSITRESDRYLIFDKLIEEIVKREFKITEKSKLYGSVRIFIPLIPETTVEEVQLPLKSTNEEPNLVFKKIPTNKAEASILLDDLIKFATERAQLMAYKREQEERKQSFSFGDENRIKRANENMHKITSLLLEKF